MIDTDASDAPVLTAAMLNDHDRPRFVPIIIVCAVLLFLDVVFAIIGLSSNELFAFLGIGLFFGQVMGMAVCTALLPFHGVTKQLLGVLAIGGLGILLAIFMRDAGSPIPTLMIVTIFVQWVIYMVPLVGIRLRGWTFDWQHKQEGSESETQFGLKRIFIWTALVAVLLAIGKSTRVLGADQNQITSSEFFLFANLALGNAILVLPMIWGSFVRKEFPLWLGGMTVWPLFLTPIQLYLIHHSMPTSPTELLGFALLNVVQVIVSMCLLFSMRYAGIRLTKAS